MAVDFVMPKLGLTMEEGTIVQWLVDDGADVQAGMPVLTIETDKVESDVECSGSGRLRQLGKPGDTFKCGEVIGRLLEASEAERAPAPIAAGSRLFASPNARRLAHELGVDLHTVQGTGPGGRIVSEDVESAPRQAARATAPAPATAKPTATRVPATAAARQLADLLGIDLAAVAPDPLQQYVTREAVALHVRALLRGEHVTPPAPLAQEATSIVSLTGRRGTIAKRMHASLREMAQLTLTMDADFDAVVAHREAHGDPRPGYTDYVIAATARALRAHPRVNAQVTAEGIALLPRVHVGFAVALDDGLVVPVIRDADQLGLDAIAAESTRLADAARTGRLARADIEAGTFSVSALGMYGVDAFTPVINPPNVAILGIGRIRQVLELRDAVVTARACATLSLTWDHRALDGAPAAEFCATIVRLLADPSALSATSSRTG